MKTKEELDAMSAAELREYADVYLYGLLDGIDAKMQALQAKRREISRHYLSVGQRINTLEEELSS